MERSQIVEAYIARVLELRREREGRAVEQDELEQIAFESGLSKRDLELARAEMQKSVIRGRGFLSYQNWVRAVEEFQQAVALDPNNSEALIFLAHALWNHGVSEEDEREQYRAMQYAERGIQIDPANAAGVKLVTHMTENPGEPYGARVTRKKSGAGPVPDGRAKKVIAGAVAAALLVMGMSIAVFFVAEDQAGKEGDLRREVTSYESENDPSFVTEVAAFGKKGVGAGYFDDARFVGADAMGNLYVGEYTTGRVQVLDHRGNWIAEWVVPGESALRSLAVARDGTVWAVRDGRITRFSGPTGEPLGLVEYEQGRGFDDIYVSQSGVAAAWRGMRRAEGITDDAVFFEPDGTVKDVMIDALAHATDHTSIDGIAVAGNGTIYMLESFDDRVYVFTPGLSYRTWFGESGDEPGQLRAPSDIAVTNRGDVLISDAKGIQVFSQNGRYKGLIDVDGAASGMTVDQDDVVWVAVRDGVRGYRVVSS